MFLLYVFGLLALVSAYVGLRLLPALPLGPLSLGAAVAVLCLPVGLALATLLARRFGGSALARRFGWAASLTLGWVTLLLVLTLLREPVLALADWLAPAAVAHATQADSALAVPTLAALATLLGVFSALRPRLVEVSIPLPGLPLDLRGFSILQLSDVHIGRTIRRRFVERLVARCNALHPDLVAITGDLVDGSVAELAAQVAPLARLRARHGTWFVTGNHEYYSGAAEWIVELRRLGMHVLLNEHAVLRHGAAELIIAGVTDTSAHAFDPFQRSDPQRALQGAPAQLRPRILLAHRPRSAPAAAQAGFDVQLSGHTHGGQFWPWNLVVRYQEPLRTGLDRLERLWVYTSRGTGFWGPPLRLGVPAEITRVRLVAAGAAQAHAKQGTGPARPAEGGGRRAAP